MAKVFRCKDVDISEITQIPIFMGCDFEARGETEEEVLKQAVEHVRAVHAEPVEKFLGHVLKEQEGEQPATPQERTDIPEGTARSVANFMGRLNQFISGGGLKEMVTDQIYPLVLLPKLKEAIKDES